MENILDWQKIKRPLILVIGIGIIVNLLASYFLTEEFSIDQLLTVSGKYLLMAAGLALLPWFFHAVEIMIWTHFFKNRISFFRAMYVAIATDLGSSVTPTMIGGGPIKMGLLMDSGMKAGTSAALLTLTAIEDICFFVVIILASLLVVEQIDYGLFSNLLMTITDSLPLALLAIGLIVGALYYIFRVVRFSNYIKRIFVKVRNAYRECRSALGLIWSNGKLHFLAATLAICARWVCRFLILLCVAKGLNLDIDYIKLFLSQWLIDAIMTATPTPGATGGAEAGFLMLFKNQLPSAQIGVIMTVWRFISYYFVLLTSAIIISISSQFKTSKTS